MSQQTDRLTGAFVNVRVDLTEFTAALNRVSATLARLTLTPPIWPEDPWDALEGWDHWGDAEQVTFQESEA